MAGADPMFYWDACMFLAWIKDEQRPSGEMDGVREAVERSKRREVKIVTSVLTSVEVLQSRLPVGVGGLFAGPMKRVHRLGGTQRWRRGLGPRHQRPLKGPFCRVQRQDIVDSGRDPPGDSHPVSRDGISYLRQRWGCQVSWPNSVVRQRRRQQAHHMQTEGKKPRPRSKATQGLKADDPAQSERFLEAAREAGADETEEGASRAFRSVALSKKPSKPR